MNKIVLIIDDDPILRVIIQKLIYIVDTSVTCYHCENGDVGLSTLNRLNEVAENVIVLLDINMPAYDGWFFLDGLQKMNLENLEKIAFYIISSSIDESDKIKSGTYSLIRKFYSKPLSKLDIIEFLN